MNQPTNQPVNLQQSKRTTMVKCLYVFIACMLLILLTACEEEVPATLPDDTLSFKFNDQAFAEDNEVYWGETGVLTPAMPEGKTLNDDGWTYEVYRDSTLIYSDEGSMTSSYVSKDDTSLQITFNNEDDKFNGVNGDLGGATTYKIVTKGNTTEGKELEGAFDYDLPNVGLQIILHGYDTATKQYTLRFRLIPSDVVNMLPATGTLSIGDVSLFSLSSSINSISFYTYIGTTKQGLILFVNQVDDAIDTDDTYGKLLLDSEYTIDADTISIGLASSIQAGGNFAIALQAKLKLSEGSEGSLRGKSFVIPLGYIFNQDSRLADGKINSSPTILISDEGVSLE